VWTASATLAKPGMNSSEDALRGVVSFTLVHLIQRSAKEGGPEFLIQFAEGYGMETIESNVTLEALTADKWEAELLEIAPKTPILALSGVELGPDRSPVCFSRTLCRSDTCQFSFRLVRDSD
jgi:DNA-binding GntR family transcriptional regulator